MEHHSDWYNQTIKELNLYKDSFSQKDSKKYKLDLLLRITTRVDSFGPACGACQLFQRQITQLAENLGDLSQLSREERKHYFKVIRDMVKHLKQHHKLITERHNIGIWIVVGAALGIVIGSSFGNIGVWAGIGIGAVVGLTIGIYLYSKAKQEGRLI